jgi:segregation and condensation protein A
MDASSDPAPAPERLSLQLDGFEGPLDLLLELARAQKVDLARISILALVDQYLAVIEGARAVRLELAADWLVMAAWLAWLKSRLLLPPDDAGAEEGEVAADILAGRLRDFQAMRVAALWLGERPMLGRDVFARGVPEDMVEIDRSRYALDLPALLRAYLGAAKRAARGQRYTPPPLNLWSVKDALGRLAAVVGGLPDWTTLERFLPDGLATPLQRRAAMASTLIAGLEMARDGSVQLRQDRDFGPILLGRPAPPAPGANAQTPRETPRETP